MNSVPTRRQAARGDRNFDAFRSFADVVKVECSGVGRDGTGARAQYRNRYRTFPCAADPAMTKVPS